MASSSRSLSQNVLVHLQWWEVEHVDIPFLLQLISKLEDFDLDLALPLVLEYARIRLSLPMLQIIYFSSRVGRSIIAWSQVGQVALNIA
jgi:hypothetical protein